MDGLWDPPNHQEIEDTNCGIDGCQCAFCLANDVVEETTQNEMSCIEVLRILISKADSDIIELEDELMELLSQLVSTDEEFSNMFSMYLRKEINFLNISIRKFKNDAGNYLPTTTRKPAESILDILKSLFSIYIQKKDKKFVDNKKNIESASCQVHSDVLLRDKKETGSCSNGNEMEKYKRVINTSMEKDARLQMKVKAEEEEDTDFPISFLYTGNSQGSMEKWKNLVGKIKSQTNSSSPSPLLEKADVANTPSGLHMDCYKLEELRAMAKQRGLKGYSKLRKFELAQRLNIQIIEGNRKQKN